MDGEIEHPHHRHHTIGIALHHGEVMLALVPAKRTARSANSLPYVELAHSSRMTLDGSLRPSLAALNSGVGPAQIRSVSVTVDGRPVADLEAGRGQTRMATATLLNRMMRADETTGYVMAIGPAASSPLAKAFMTARNADRIVTTVCSRSVFEECWVNGSAGMTRPRRVENCPMPKVQYRS